MKHSNIFIYFLLIFSITLIKSHENNLFHAVKDGNLGLVRDLAIQKNIDINAVDNNGLTVLMIAASKGDRTVVKVLLDAGASVDTVDSSGNTALMLAIKVGSDQTVNFILEKDDNIDIKNNSGNTPLMIAVKKGYDKIVKLLLGKSVKVNIIDNAGNTPLMVSIGKKNINITKLLLDSGANVNIPNKEGVVPLMVASFYGDKFLAEELLEKGADINIQDSNGITALKAAEMNANKEVYELLKLEQAIQKKENIENYIKKLDEDDLIWLLDRAENNEYILNVLPKFYKNLVKLSKKLKQGSITGAEIDSVLDYKSKKNKQNKSSIHKKFKYISNIINKDKFVNKDNKLIANEKVKKDIYKFKKHL